MLEYDDQSHKYSREQHIGAGDHEHKERHAQTQQYNADDYLGAKICESKFQFGDPGI